MRTGVDTDREVFGDPGPTLGAELGGVPGRDFNYLATSLFRFEAQDVEEPKPGHIPHGPVERPGAGPRAHLLNVDGVIALEKIVGHLEVEVPPLVADLLVGLGHQDSGLGPALGALRPPGEPPLPHDQDSLGLFEEAGVVYGLAFRGGQEGLTAHIYADSLPGLGQGLFRHTIAGEGDGPGPRSAVPDGDGLDVPLNGPGKAHLKGADLLDGQTFAFQLPAGLFQGEGVIPAPALEAGEAGLAVAILHPAEEAGIGPVQALNDILEDLGADPFVFREGGPELGELSLLVIGRDRPALAGIGADALLQGGIVEASAEVQPEGGFLKGSLITLETVQKGLLHLPCTNANIAIHARLVNSPEGGKPCRASPSVSPALKGGVLDGGTPIRAAGIEHAKNGGMRKCIEASRAARIGKKLSADVRQQISVGMKKGKKPYLSPEKARIKGDKIRMSKLGVPHPNLSGLTCLGCSSSSATLGQP